MIPSPRQVEPSYSENRNLYQSDLRDSHDRKEDEPEARHEGEQQEALCQGLGISPRHPEDDTGTERWDGDDGLVMALDALSGRFGRIQAPIGLRDAAAGRGNSDARQKRLSQSYFGNSHRLSGAW